MAETLPPGRASPICATMSSTGQSLHRAAISKKVAAPGLFARAWTSRMSAIAMASSFSPVGWSTPATRNVLPPEATVPPGPLSRSAAASDPRRTSPFPRGSVPRTFHQRRATAISPAGTPIHTMSFPEASAAVRKKGTTDRRRSLSSMERIASPSDTDSFAWATCAPPREMSPNPSDSCSVRGTTRIFAPHRSSLSRTAPSLCMGREERETNVPVPRKIPRPVNTARDLLRNRFFQASLRIFISRPVRLRPLPGEVILPCREVALPAHQGLAINHPGQWRRVAPPLHLVDLHARKGLAAFVAHHEIASRPVSTVRPETDVAGVVGGPVHAVRAPHREEIDTPSLEVRFEKKRFPGTEGRKGDAHGVRRFHYARRVRDR